MNKENLQEVETKEKKLVEDLQFMRLAIEKTHRQIDPGAYGMITWGFICMILYPAIQIMVTMHLYKWIYPTAYSLPAIGVILNFWFGYKLTRREKESGFVSHISKQIGWIWGILVVNGMFWCFLSIKQQWNPYFPGYLWAWIYASALSATGIIYSKEWLLGGIAIFITMAIGVFFLSYSYYFLGPVMGLACIIPSIIALRRLKHLKKRSED